MPIITVDKLGLTNANPKPVRGVNWCGNPMKEGDSYWGESTDIKAPFTIEHYEALGDKPQPRPRKAKRSHSAWSPERRAAYGAKMKAWWQAKKSSAPEAEAQEQGQQNNQQ